jgi:hypothetical protein
MEKRQPLMSIAYNQYCSNFPRATSFFSEIQASIPKKVKTTSSLRRGETLKTERELRGSAISLRSSMSFRRKELFSPLREKRITQPKTHSSIVRRHTIIGRPSPDGDDMLTESKNFLKRTLSPRKSHENNLSGRQLNFLDGCLARSVLGSSLPLIAFLLEPVQRVMRYPLLLKGLKYYLALSDDTEEKDMIVTERALQIADKLAIITNITQPYPSRVVPSISKSAPTSPQTKSPVKNSADKKRRSFEFMRQAAERLLRSR